MNVGGDIARTVGRSDADQAFKPGVWRLRLTRSLASGRSSRPNHRQLLAIMAQDTGDASPRYILR